MDEDETKNKEAFINTFKYHVTKFANEQFSNYENIEKYIKKITLEQKAENLYGHNKENEAKITYDHRKGLNEINVTDYKIIYRMNS